LSSVPFERVTRTAIVPITTNPLSRLHYRCLGARSGANPFHGRICGDPTPSGIRRLPGMMQ
jgi:hypothetical protein